MARQETEITQEPTVKDELSEQDVFATFSQLKEKVPRCTSAANAFFF